MLLPGAVLAAAATWALAALFERTRWADAGDGVRKLQPRPVPAVGGAAILLSWVALAAGGSLGFPGFWPDAGGSASATASWSALALAFATGLCDDLRRGGLLPSVKLAGQAAAGLALSVPIWLGGPPSIAAALGGTLLCVLAACVALNVWNTFDNADGAAAGLGAAGLIAAQSSAAGALIGFLPFNLLAHRRGGPRAYLGDAGSHAVGMALLLTPAAWPAFLLPLLDLLRLCVLRARRGRRPWQGDRRHLAHRLEAAGLSPAAVLAVLLVVAAPALAVAGPVGLCACALLFALAVGATPRAGESGPP